MTNLSDHIRKPLEAIIEDTPGHFYYKVHPKFIKWLSVSRFKYPEPNLVQEIVEHLRTMRIYSRGMTLYVDPTGIRCVTIIYGGFFNYPLLVHTFIVDYLESCKFSVREISLESVVHTFYDIKFTFTQSPTQ